MPHMQLRLDPWPVDTQDGQLTLKPFAGSVFDAEASSWQALPLSDIPQRLNTVLVVDGRPRMEARLLMDDQAGNLSVAGFGAYVVGAVNLCPHGSRAAELTEVRAKRVLAFSKSLSGALLSGTVSPESLSPRHPQTGQLEYQPSGFESRQIDGPRAHVQALMLRAEQELGYAKASTIPLDEEELDTLPETLVLQDGTVRVGEAGRAVLGYVKTLHTDYLGADRIGLLTQLRPGERTPILRFRMGDQGGSDEAEGREQRFTWYVRLSEAPFYQHPLAGVMRLEMQAPEDTEFVPKAVIDIANLSGALLKKLGSKAYKDARAPQNLIPTAALEQAMSRAMGNADLVTRRIRAHLMRQGVLT